MSKKLLIVASCLLLVASMSLAKTSTDISVVSQGARSVALGRSGVALIGTNNNPFVNPAAISATESWEFTSMSTQVLGQVDYKYMGVSYKTPKGTIGLSYVGAASPAGYFATDESSLGSALANPINYGSNVIALSYGSKLGDIMPSTSLGEMSIGTNLKYYQQGFSGASSATASGYSFDFGAILQPNSDVSYGINCQNLMAGSMNWDNNTQEEFKSATSIGAARKLWNEKLLLSADIAFSDLTTLHGGVEWKPVETIALRTGIDQGIISDAASTNLTAGVGLYFKDFDVDLAYRNDTTLANNSSFYLSLAYSPFVPKKIINSNTPEKAAEEPGNDYMDSTKSTKKDIDKDIKEAVTNPHKAEKETSTASGYVNDYYQSLGIMK